MAKKRGRELAILPLPLLSGCYSARGHLAGLEARARACNSNINVTVRGGTLDLFRQAIEIIRVAPGLRWEFWF